MEGWRKSTYSDGNGGNCVEVAATAEIIKIRDTADREGVTLSFSAGAWAEFVATLRG
jgi:Domain of unknown function (DUF397)